MDKRRFLGLMASLTAMAGGAWARSYPSRPVRMSVPWPAGGSGDAMGRAIAVPLSARAGQQFVVDNLPGSGGPLGIGLAAKAPADGYTLVQVTAAATINAALHPQQSFDLARDFAPVAQVATLPLVMVVHPDVPANSVAEFVAYARKHPDQLNYASPGIGSGGHLTAEMFKSVTGASLTHVPYKGAALAMSDLLSGRVHVFFDGLPSSLPHIKAGKLKVLAVTTGARFEGLPDVPTLTEQGVAMESSVWFGFMVPAGTDPKIVDYLGTAINQVVDTPAMKDRIVQLGFQPVPALTPAQFHQHIRAEIDRWGAIIKSARITAE